MDQAQRPVSVTVAGIPVRRDETGWYTHHSTGRIIDLLARRVREVHYHGPLVPDAAHGDYDYPLNNPNIHVHPLGVRRNTLAALKRPDRLLREYWTIVRRGDVVFLRGSPALVWTAHWFARLRGKRVLHWIVGNPVAILRGDSRGYGSLTHKLGLAFAIFEQMMTRLGIWASRARVLANGCEVARIFRTPRTTEVVSTSISDDDFRVREDTCTGDRIRLLFVGFIRPEKGIQYLLRALPLIQSPKPIELALVGSWEKFSTIRDEFDAIIREVGYAGRVTWEGYAAFGEALFGQIDRSDVLILPSLSEGTPRVLIEARARSVPVVSTNVGGIPSSVADGVDGLLVPPRDPEALARAISRVLNDAALRRSLIRQGRERVASLTIEKFVDLVVDRLSPP